VSARVDGAGTTVAGAERSISRTCALAWRHPEWWSLAVSLIAWGVLLTQWPHSPSDGDHALLHQAHTGPAHGHVTVTLAISHLVGWAVMIAAMMLPLVAAHARAIAFASLWRRRHRAIGEFLIGYVAIWLAAGIPIVAIVVLPSAHRLPGGGTAPLAALGFAIAAAWQLTSFKRRALRACHRTVPLGPRGWRADVDCVHSGVVAGRSCVANCWAMMLATALTAHHPAAMLTVTVLGVAERYATRPRPKVIAGILAGLSLACAALAASDMTIP
jgi:predicted metal-binding membrane protein